MNQTKKIMMEIETRSEPLTVEQHLAYSRALRAAADADERSEKRRQRVKATLRKILIILRG